MTRIDFNEAVTMIIDCLVETSEDIKKMSAVVREAAIIALRVSDIISKSEHVELSRPGTRDFKNDVLAAQIVAQLSENATSL